MSFVPNLPIVPQVNNPQLRLWCEQMQVMVNWYLANLQGQTTTNTTALAAISTSFQPLDSDLTAIAALSTTSFGLSFLTLADAAAARALIGAPNTTFTIAQFWFGIRPLSGAAGTLAAADGSLADATDMDGFVSGRNMADAARTDHAFTWVVPDELDTTQVVTAVAYYRLAAAGTGAAVEVQTTLRIVADNALLLSGGTQVDTAAVVDVATYAAGDLVVHSLGTVIGVNKLATNNVVKGTVFRDAQVGNADDTFANTINLISLKFTGTRKTA